MGQNMTWRATGAALLNVSVHCKKDRLIILWWSKQKRNIEKFWTNNTIKTIAQHPVMKMFSLRQTMSEKSQNKQIILNVYKHSVSTKATLFRLTEIDNLKIYFVKNARVVSVNYVKILIRYKNSYFCTTYYIFKQSSQI